MTRARPLPSFASVRSLATVALLAITGPAGATTIFVAAHGVDGVACGTKEAPCRSLSRGVARSAPGDTVEVGAGRYGDLDGDGSFTDPGDEAAEIDTGCDCLVHVTKPITIVSRLGAGATVIDAGGAPVDVVRIAASGTVFGKKGKGFTLTRAGDDGLFTNADGVVIAGNTAVANGDDGIDIAGGQRVTVGDNRALVNGGQGFACSGTDDSLFVRNVSSDNADRGFTVDNGNTLIANVASRNGEEGFNAQSRNILTGNVATGNIEEGFVMNDDNVVTANLAVGNHNGFRLDGNNVVSKSAAIDNAGVGILVEENGTVVTKTNISGNGGGAVNVPMVNVNCGTLTADGVTLAAPKNFWGAPGGPGPDPADLACNGIGGVTNVEPVAEKEIKIRSVAAR
jgi:hypothetical protein